MYPGRYALGLALLGIVLGPVMAWQAWEGIRNREGDYDSTAFASTQGGAWLALLIGIVVTGGALFWLVRWLPEYLFW